VTNPVESPLDQAFSLDHLLKIMMKMLDFDADHHK